MNLKPVRGKKLPLWWLKKGAIEKHSHHGQSFCGLEEYALLYPDGKEALFLPGITTTRFQLDCYKEELGKPYSQILYLCSTSEFNNVSCDAIEFNPDPKLSLPGIITNHFDKIYESEMPAIVDDQEQEPNIPVTDLENEVFDLDSYSYNQTLVTTNVDTNFSSYTTNKIPVVKIWPLNLRQSGETSWKCIWLDGIYELEIKRRKIWKHTKVKLKRQLKSSLKPIHIVFIGEPAFDTGGPLREFFTLYFDAAARNIMQGTSSSFTLLHDVKKLNNGDFERFGLLIALALIYGCPGPRNMQESLVCSLLDLPIDDGNIEDIPDFDIQTKLQELSSCADEDTFFFFLNK